MKTKFKAVVAASLAAASLAAALLITGCGSAGSKKDQRAEVTMLIGKEEIAKELDETIKKYNETQDQYTVKILPLAGQNANEKLTSLYASKNAPVLINAGAYEDLAQWKDKFLDLSDLPLVAGIDQQYLDAGTADGKLIGIPATIEAFGYLYNKDVMDAAVGGEFQPSSITNRKELKDLMDKVEALEGKKAIEFSPMDWSLGAHFSNILFTNQSEDTAERKGFMDELKSGNMTLIDNPVFNEWVDTFDMMKEYNAAKSAPLSADYDSATLGLANGDIGMWFMGNWAYLQLKEANPEARIGMMPVQISDETGTYGNEQISIGVPQTWGIDAEQSSPEQQAGAKDFLNWLYEDEVGQDYYVNKLGFIPISKNNKIEPQDELSKDVLQYLEKGQSLEWMNTQYPATAFPAMGASIQKYLDNRITKEELALEIEDYWKTNAQ